MVYIHRAVLPRFLPTPYVPELTLATVVYLAVAVGGIRSLFFAFVLGLASDLLGWGPVGLGALVATLTAAAYAPLRGRIYENSLLVPAALTALAALAQGVLSLIIFVLAPGAVSLAGSDILRLVAAALVAGAASLPLFFIYWRLLPPRRS